MSSILYMLISYDITQAPQCISPQKQRGDELLEGISVAEI